MDKVVAGMDLHSNNVMIGVMDMSGKRLASSEGGPRVTSFHFPIGFAK